MSSFRTFQTIIEDEFIRPLIWVGVGSQVGGIIVIWGVTWVLRDFATTRFVFQAITTGIVILLGAVVFYIRSSSREVRKGLSGVLTFIGRPRSYQEEIRNISYHERQARIFRGLFWLALLDFILVGALDIQSGGIWRSPFTPMLPAIAAVGSILLLPWRHLFVLYSLATVLILGGMANIPLHEAQRTLGYFSAEPEMPSYMEVRELAEESNAMSPSKEQSYKDGVIPKDDYESTIRRYERQRIQWIYAITIVGVFAGLVSLGSAYQAGKRLKYFFQREQAGILPPIKNKEERELTDLVYDAENVFNQVFMSVRFMGKYSPHQNNVHDLDEVRNQALLLAIPALHRTLTNRTSIEARDIALTTFAIHWIDDCFDAERFMGHHGVLENLYRFRSYSSREIIRRLDQGLHEAGECPLQEIFEVIYKCSNDLEKTDRAIKRILYGALIQHGADPKDRDILVEELRAIVRNGLKPELSDAVQSLSPGELWLTCKSVMELLHACEKSPPSLDISEICNFFFASLVGYSDKELEVGIEKAGDAWQLVNGVATPENNMLCSFKDFYADILRNDPREKRRLEQMLAVYGYYREKLPSNLKQLYGEVVADIEARAKVI